MPAIDELLDEYIVVRGGILRLPPEGVPFSAAYGKTLVEAAGAVPHGTIRVTTVGDIRKAGGSVVLRPELTRGGRLNDNHVEITIGSEGASFSEPFDNPVPMEKRIR